SNPEWRVRRLRPRRSRRDENTHHPYQRLCRARAVRQVPDADIVSLMTSSAEPATLLNISDIVSGPIPPRVVNAAWPNMLHTRISDVVAKMGPPPWSVRLLQDERNNVTLIANPPGTGNRPHWHKDFDEWWVILSGRLQWELTGGTVVEA